jgi:hypothetical protein
MEGQGRDQSAAGRTYRGIPTLKELLNLFHIALRLHPVNLFIHVKVTARLVCLLEILQ